MVIGILNPLPMNFLSQLEWRRAEKNFDPNKPLEQDKLNQLLHAIQMTPSSFGLQPYHVFVVSNPEVKTKLKAAAYNQAQFTDASHILVFASRTDAMHRIDAYIELATKGDASARESMKAYEDMMRGTISSRTEEALKTWADRQAYLALGFALAAAAELSVSSCPMEGFDPAQFDQILNLPANMKSSVAMTVGYSTGEPGYPKVRFPENELFTLI